MVKTIDKTIFALRRIDDLVKRGEWHYLMCLFRAIFGEHMGEHLYYAHFKPNAPYSFWFSLDENNRNAFVDFCNDKDKFNSLASTLMNDDVVKAEKNSCKTAIKRTEMSKPTEWLVKNRNICGRVLDYGCGRGEDVRRLKALGYDATGYDPYQTEYSESPTGQFDTIICNYVLNVLPKCKEYRLIEHIKSLLSPLGVAYVAVRRDIESMEGYFSSTGTFQRKVVLNERRAKLSKGNYEIYQITR